MSIYDEKLFNDFSFRMRVSDIIPLLESRIAMEEKEIDELRKKLATTPERELEATQPGYLPAVLVETKGVQISRKIEWHALSLLDSKILLRYYKTQTDETHVAVDMNFLRWLNGALLNEILEKPKEP